ncbi:hypothetical protein ACHAXR_006712 [Thalassiosira sp. AJA248-18]
MTHHPSSLLVPNGRHSVHRKYYDDEHRPIPPRIKMRSTISILVIIYLHIIMCMSSASTTTSHENKSIFAEAWVPPPTYNNRLTRYQSSSKSTPTAYRQSKITRWYVHEDETNRVDGERISLSSNQNNDIAEDHQNQRSVHFKPKAQLDLKILLIDNHDSYTYNLYQYISTMTIHPLKVVMNDAFSSWDDFVASLGPNSTATDLDQFDCIILSPGPGQPSQPADIGIVLETIRRNANIPILGVCLGHQALGYVYGNEVKLSPCGPVHGLMSSVVYNESDESEQDLTCQLFRDLPQDFEVVRYHSLVVDFPEPWEDLEIEPIAWCNSLKQTSNSSIQLLHDSDENICMGLRHKRYPHYGVQFHPESIGTGEAGYQLLWNFCEFAHQYKQRGNAKSEEAPITHRNQAVDTQSELITDASHLTANEPERMDGAQTANDEPSTTSKYRVFIHKVDRVQNETSSLPQPKQVFEALYSSRPNSFWLDSSTGDVQSNKDETSGPDIMNGDEGCPITGNSRFSIMGSNDGPLSRKIEYFGREHDPKQRGLRVISKSGEEDGMLDEDILSYLRHKLVEEHEAVDKAEMVTFDEGLKNNSVVPGYTLNTIKEFGQTIQTGASDQIPFDYRGGYVGYLGYEVRHDTQCWIFEQEGGFGCGTSSHDSILNRQGSSGTTNPNIPTAAFLFVDRSLVYDHQTGDWYIIGTAENDFSHSDDEAECSEESVNDTVSWMRLVKSKIESVGENMIANNMIHSIHRENVVETNDVEFVPNRPKTQYQRDISRSHKEIRNGESYELCVTNQLEAELKLPKQSSKANHESPFELYKLLRENNPAPFSAFANFNKEEGSSGNSASLSICCSSPERFLSVKKAKLTPKVNIGTLNQPLPKRRFVVESKPIKGTAARYTGASNGVEEPNEFVKRINSQIVSKLRESVKDQAENLMIVDLLRNDLGRVCQVGSVYVPKLMQIESYATVHQMVSTVRGTLDGDATNAIDVIEACFPGGSMTGAPKQRTMEILDEIEQGVSRGPYSGCLGYISLNGCMDMNIVIRSAVLTPSNNHDDDNEETIETWKASIGCGGAITALSNSDDEYEEMLLKSRVVRRTISEWVAQATQQRRRTDDTRI